MNLICGLYFCCNWAEIKEHLASNSELKMKEHFHFKEISFSLSGATARTVSCLTNIDHVTHVPL